VLSAGIVANADNKALSQFLKVPLDADGFFLEAHVKLRPVDFATDGVFVCGLSHYPKDISETIAQARAAAGRAATVLSKETIEAEGKVSYIREDRCSGCGACEEVCAYSAIELDPDRQLAVVNEALCKGCGACAATCRAGAVDLSGFRNEQILNVLAAM
jgi:heterodisulfide reductase subunit A